MRRVDALPARRPALAKLTGTVLSLEPDPELQRLVTDASQQLAAPIALVSLVLERTQLFRAQVGLPPDLATALATDRDASFCQFVVHDKTIVEVSETRADDRLPQELVERYGLRSYLGAPILLDDEAVGAVCVMDRTPRTFGDADRARIAAAAQVASARLAELARQPGHDHSLHELAVRPQFAELRNRLQPILGGVASMQIALAELSAVHRIAAYVASHPEEAATVVPFENADEALQDLEECLEEVSAGVGHVRRAIEALESASLGVGTSCHVRELVDAANTLAHHHTKLIGGVTWEPAPDVVVPVPLPVAVNALAAALSGMSGDVRRSGRGGRGLRGQITSDAAAVCIRLVAPDLGAGRLAIHAAALARLVDGALQIRHDTEGLELAFARD